MNTIITTSRSWQKHSLCAAWVQGYSRFLGMLVWWNHEDHNSLDNGKIMLSPTKSFFFLNLDVVSWWSDIQIMSAILKGLVKSYDMKMKKVNKNEPKSLPCLPFRKSRNEVQSLMWENLKSTGDEVEDVWIFYYYIVNDNTLDDKTEIKISCHSYWFSQNDHLNQFWTGYIICLTTITES